MEKKLTLTLTLTLFIYLLGCKNTKAPEMVYEHSTDLKKAESYLLTRKDSAFYYLNRVISGEKDSLQLAVALNLMSYIQNDMGDYYGAQETALESLSYLSDLDSYRRYYLSSNYNELAVANLYLRNYQTSIEYADKAIALTQDSSIRAIALNNKAMAFQQAGDYKSALSILETIRESNLYNRAEYARVLSNIAKVKWLKNPDYNPLDQLLLAKSIREKIGDNSGLSTSYYHLSEYYSKTNKDSAYRYAGLMYQQAKLIENPDDELDALRKLIENGPLDSIRSYFARYTVLNDSVYAARNAAKNQFALIRYEAEKRRMENLSLQQENAEKGIQILKQRFAIAASIVVFTVVVVLGYILNKKRRQKILSDSRNAIREERFKTSQKVHDVVANGLYRVMSELEHMKIIDKEKLLDQVEALYEQSRDISYEQDQDSVSATNHAIERLIYSFAGQDVKILLVGNNGETWEHVSEQTKMEVKHILQELMVNMRKHSNAANVLVRFESKDGILTIRYTDDGIGFQKQFLPGNGLTNTGNRIKRLGGQITFDTEALKGARIIISLPTGS